MNTLPSQTKFLHFLNPALTREQKKSKKSEKPATSGIHNKTKYKKTPDENDFQTTWPKVRRQRKLSTVGGGESTLDLCYARSEEIPELQRPRQWRDVDAPQKSSMWR